MLKQGTWTLVFNVCTRLLCSRKTAAQKRSTHETIQDNTEQEPVQGDPWVTITRAGRWAGGTLVGGGLPSQASVRILILAIFTRKTTRTELG